MIDEEHEKIVELWDSIMDDVYTLICTKLSAQPLSKEQIQFAYEKCTESLYHAGWKAIEHLTPTEKRLHIKY